MPAHRVGCRSRSDGAGRLTDRVAQEPTALRDLPFEGRGVPTGRPSAPASCG
ncbi:hypothetical protein MINT15_34820 [Saccharomonospora viridis]|uniref:Uncharacterized protein n=1 Tax=Saccharomonospora viridis TaxID=1852 RepID=A0A837D6R0_9PSEU|nr:hypothetical protein MINT15_34820 [Saccharomonospora viridis]